MELFIDIVSIILTIVRIVLTIAIHIRNNRR